MGTPVRAQNFGISVSSERMRTTAKAKDTDLGRGHVCHWRFNGMWGFTSHGILGDLPMISGV